MLAPSPSAPARAPGRSRLGGPAAWVAAGALLAFWILYVSTLKGVDGDYYWHLLAGRLMLSGHPPFKVDEFSWTAAGRPWFDHEWLGEVILARLSRLGGIPAVKAAYAAMLIAWYGLVLAIFLRARAGLAMASWGALATCLSAGTEIWPRMQGFTLVGMALTMLVLQTTWKHPDQRLKTPWLVGYPVAVGLWANVHGGGALAGPASCLIALVAATCARLARHQRPAVLWDRVTLTLGAWIALLCNPRGPKLAAYAMGSVWNPRIRAMNALIPEWHAFSWSDPTCRHVAWWTLAVLGAALVAWFLARSPRAGGAPGSTTVLAQNPAAVPAIALASVWAILGGSAHRHLPLFALALAPLAGSWLAAARDARATTTPGRRVALRILATVAVLVTIGPAIADRLINGPLDTGLRFPSHRALAAAVALAPGHRILNLYDWGGELIEAGYPRVKDFVDGREYPFGLAINLAHDTMVGARPGWRSAMARYGIDLVFVPPDVPLAARLRHDPRWRTAYEDKTAILLLR